MKVGDNQKHLGLFCFGGNQKYRFLEHRQLQLRKALGGIRQLGLQQLLILLGLLELLDHIFLEHKLMKLLEYKLMKQKSIVGFVVNQHLGLQQLLERLEYQLDFEGKNVLNPLMDVRMF